MKKYLTLFHTLALFALQVAFAQTPINLFNWQVHSSQVNILSATVDKGGHLWCATDGGVFRFKPNSDDSFLSYNSINGLNSIETRFIAYNIQTDEIYVGTNDGALSIYSPEKGWENILDIRKSLYTRLEINHILFQDSIAFISGGFGFTTFDVYKKVFLKTP
ncbi:MAG: hypothetical protein ACK42Z_10015, partial [Candidatus Kapaibacteriota bacterium]